MALSSEHLNAYMVTWKLEREFGGMTTVCIQRAGLFAQRYGRAFVVTFNRAPDQPQIVDELVGKGKLSPDVQVLNLYLDLAQRAMAPQEPVAAKKFDPATADLALDDTVAYPEAPERPFSQHFTDGRAKGTRQTRFLRKDGSTFLIDTKGFDHQGKKRRCLEVLAADGTVIARFNTAPALYRYWLSSLAENENSLVVVDSKYTAALLDQWKTTKVPKLYAFHSIHVAKGEPLQTGQLSDPHAPIIEARAQWDGFVFLTAAQRDAYVRRFGDAERCFVIPNPLKASTLPGPPPQRHSTHLIAAGSLTANKNVAASIKVVAELVRRGHHPVLHVVGQGSQRDKLEALSRELGVDDLVLFHGYSDRLPELFASCTAQLFTSTNEGQALVLLEAQQQGCIPVSFDINFGPADSIRDGVNGFLVAPGDLQAMAERVEQLITEGQLAASMSARCREFAREYAANDVIARWVETRNKAARLKADGTRDDLPDFSARIASLEFLPDDGLALGISVSEPLPRHAEIELVILDRDTKAQLQSISATQRQEQRLVFALSAQLLQAAAGEDAPSDVYLRCRLGGSVELKRLGVKKSRALPYFTTHNNLSFKPQTGQPKK
ncbi:glycosyltransferase [Glutamicibacter sp. JL.03c]|uniref:glycosyltransferase n=1 Tax=Glutamicibacter sp. JL.03c TaxID=2984842 RepID=UPI0021F743AF|nr:glycosyltransferase [Glutamicibacter sp. JL.03c]UYQ78903.1 glycosyltransferase [Glutamicibacter sp. JL.03c]